jgi:hypothetical protein
VSGTLPLGIHMWSSRHAPGTQTGGYYTQEGRSSDRCPPTAACLRLNPQNRCTQHKHVHSRQHRRSPSPPTTAPPPPTPTPLTHTATRAWCSLRFSSLLRFTHVPVVAPWGAAIEVCGRSAIQPKPSHSRVHVLGTIATNPLGAPTPGAQGGLQQCVGRLPRCIHSGVAHDWTWQLGNKVRPCLTHGLRLTCPVVNRWIPTPRLEQELTASSHVTDPCPGFRQLWYVSAPELSNT